MSGSVRVLERIDMSIWSRARDGKMLIMTMENFSPTTIYIPNPKYPESKLERVNSLGGVLENESRRHCSIAQDFSTSQLAKKNT